MKIHLALGHSSGRGVGYYTEFLKQALEDAGISLVEESKADLVHYPFFDLFYPTLPLLKTKKTVVTVHDVTPLVLSKLYPQGIKGSFSLLHQKVSLRLANMVITDSLNSKKDINSYLGIKKAKIKVIPLAVDPTFLQMPSQQNLNEVKTKYQLPPQFLLTVAGGPNRNKNLPLLASATEKLNLPLVIVGGGMVKEVSSPVHPELADLTLLKRYSHLILPGFVPTSDLLCLYQLAVAYCQASLYEGFGLPVLEAMTAGCLVISSNTSSLPEIHGESAITFNPQDENDLIRAITKSLNLKPQTKGRKVELGEKLSRNYAWSKTAQLTIAVYKDVLSR